MKWFPWVGMAFFAVLAAAGWYEVISSKDRANQVAQHHFRSEESTIEGNALRADEKGKTQSSMLFSDVSTKGTKKDVRVPLKAKSSPEDRIQRKAERLAERIAHQKIEAYKEEEKSKEKEGVFRYFDGMETLFSRSIDSYAEAFDVDEDKIDALHQIVIDGFAKQRDITARYYAGELTEKEAKRQGAQAHEEDKIRVAALLGEEGAEDFGLMVREEGAKMKAEKAMNEK
ncbi:MAG: hypothetical protein VX278_10425 [Myxococcota bacterium]|nr:hypothetical protein [Myxococcota bacterium]